MPSVNELATAVKAAMVQPGSFDSTSPIARAHKALDDLVSRAYVLEYVTERLLASGPLAEAMQRIQGDIGRLATKADATEKRADHANDNLSSLNKMLGVPRSVVGADDFGELANLRLQLANVEERLPKPKKVGKAK